MTPASSGTYQKLVWSDEFDGQGAIDGSKWNTEVTCAPQNNENQCYTGDAQNLTQDGQGHLVVQANRQAGLANGKAFSSARINSAQKGDFTYGRVEARIKIPKGQGVWPAFWLMPTDSVYGAWPTSGELDIMEILGSNTNTLYGTAHYGLPQPYVQQQGQSNAADFSLDYHVYALERDAKQIRWYVDGQLFYTMNDNQTAFWPNNATQGADGSPWPFNQRFYVIFNLAMGGDWPGAVDGNINQATMLIDYVRIYN
ncbi:MAG: glycoside hydrolase family 16 protein [Oxalobacteraceae bacterium]|nr:MAG: glycoside hydrolase family 16 protein [Oxalobacteraceae bacterium]